MNGAMPTVEQVISGAIRDAGNLLGHPDGNGGASAQLQTIESLLALQVRLLGLSLGLERDGEAWAHAKHDLAAVFRGELDEIRPGNHLEARDLADDELGDVMADGVPNPAVDDRREVFSHSNLLTLHGFAARYVAGAVLTPFQWLHRKAGIRQVLVPRGLSDATPTGGGAA